MTAEKIIKIVEENLAIDLINGTAWCEPPGPRLVKEYLEKNYIKKNKKLTLNQVGQWLNVMIVGLPEIAENKKRLNEAQELIVKGTAMALGYDKN